MTPELIEKIITSLGVPLGIVVIVVFYLIKNPPKPENVLKKCLDKEDLSEIINEIENLDRKISEVQNSIAILIDRTNR